MASPTRFSSHSSTPGSEEDPRLLMEQKMRKRKLSNGESARRSRVRKQNHIQELADQLDQLKKEQQQLKANLNLTRQLYMNVEAEGLVIQAQMTELSYRLAYLNETSRYMMPFCSVDDQQQANGVERLIMDPWSLPIMASADMFMY